MSAARRWTTQEQTTPIRKEHYNIIVAPPERLSGSGKRVKRRCTCDVLVRALEHAPWFAQTLPCIDRFFSAPWTRVSLANMAHNGLRC